MATRLCFSCLGISASDPVCGFVPEPAGALVPSVDDCLDRLYTELVPAEDVARMRVRPGGSQSLFGVAARTLLES